MNYDLTSSGTLVTDRNTAIARGRVEGSQPFGSYGEFTATGAVTNHLIWPDGDFNIPAATGVQVTLISTSTEDGVGGTGIRSIELHYLDGNLLDQFETVILNGTTGVLTTATDIRFIQCMHVLTIGTAKQSVGVINATNSTVVYSQIPVGARRCASSARMIPAGKSCYIAGVSGGAISGTAATGALIRISSTWFEGHDLTSNAILIPFGSMAMQDNSVSYTFPLPAGPFPAGAIIAMEVTLDKAATVTGDWFGWVEATV